MGMRLSGGTETEAEAADSIGVGKGLRLGGRGGIVMLAMVMLDLTTQMSVHTARRYVFRSA